MWFQYVQHQCTSFVILFLFSGNILSNPEIGIHGLAPLNPVKVLPYFMRIVEPISISSKKVCTN